jgi:hypothetical protein
MVQPTPPMGHVEAVAVSLGLYLARYIPVWRTWACTLPVDQLEVLPGSHEQLQFCLFRVLDFSLFGPFLTLFVQNDHFLGLIFPFLSFFQFQDTVYSQTDLEAVLLPIQKRLSSGPIGPLSLPVCPNCVFGLEPLVSLGPIAIEYSQLLLTAVGGPTSRTRYSSARGGGPRG